MAAKRFLKNEFLIKVSILLRGIKVFSTDTLVYPGKQAPQKSTSESSSGRKEVLGGSVVWRRSVLIRYSEGSIAWHRVIGGEELCDSVSRSWLRGRGGVEGKGEFLVAHQRRHRSQCRRCNQVCGGGERSFG